MSAWRRVYAVWGHDSPAHIGGVRRACLAWGVGARAVVIAETLKELHTTLKGDATLSSLDGYLHLRLTSDGLGHISVMGEL
jgi:hypothetical protein